MEEPKTEKPTMEVKEEDENENGNAMDEKSQLMERQKDLLNTYLSNLAIRTAPITDFLAQVEAFHQAIEALEENIAQVFRREVNFYDDQAQERSPDSFFDTSEEQANDATMELSSPVGQLVDSGDSALDQNVEHKSPMVQDSPKRQLVDSGDSALDQNVDHKSPMDSPKIDDNEK